MNDHQRYRVLFLCTGNSARSIMAEAILNHLGGDRFAAFSAGSHPTGTVNPFALELLRSKGLAVEKARSKSWDEFADGPALDFVFTVCDNAAAEVCPAWPGQPMSAHWGTPDPAAVSGDDETKRRAFRQAYSELEARIRLFLSLPIERLDRLSLRRRLDEIGAETADSRA